MRLPYIAIFFRIFAHSADGPPTLKKLPQGKNTFVELGILAATSDQLSFSQHQKTDFLFVYILVLAFLTWPRKTLVIYPLSGLVNNVEVMWILAGNFFLSFLFLLLPLKNFCDRVVSSTFLIRNKLKKLGYHVSKF